MHNACKSGIQYSLIVLLESHFYHNMNVTNPVAKRQSK